DFLDLVEQGPVADLQELGGPDAVPAGLLEDTGDRLPLGRPRRRPGQLLERYDGRAGRRSGTAVDGSRGGPAGRGDRASRDGGSPGSVAAGPARAQERRALEPGIVEDDHPFHEVLELPDIPREAVPTEALDCARREGEFLAVKGLCIALGKVSG